MGVASVCDQRKRPSCCCMRLLRTYVNCSFPYSVTFQRRPHSTTFCIFALGFCFNALRSWRWMTNYNLGRGEDRTKLYIIADVYCCVVLLQSVPGAEYLTELRTAAVHFAALCSYK